MFGQILESGERVGLLLQSKAAVEHEVIELLNCHDFLSAHLPRHMQHVSSQPNSIFS